MDLPGIDSVLAAGRDLYALQASISADYVDPRDGLQTVWQVMAADAREAYN